jgi:hypothetical protein
VKRGKSAWGVGFVKATGFENLDLLKCLDTLARGLHSWF